MGSSRVDQNDVRFVAGGKTTDVGVLANGSRATQRGKFNRSSAVTAAASQLTARCTTPNVSRSDRTSHASLQFASSVPMPTLMPAWRNAGTGAIPDPRTPVADRLCRDRSTRSTNHPDIGSVDVHAVPEQQT